MERESTAAIARRAIGCIDLTDLDDDCTADDVERLCAAARQHGVAAVCVWPDFVAQAATALAGSDVRVATVINFPTGDERAHASAVLAARASRMKPSLPLSPSQKEMLKFSLPGLVCSTKCHQYLGSQRTSPGCSVVTRALTLASAGYVSKSGCPGSAIAKLSMGCANGYG